MNALVVVLMVGSGLRIFDAYPGFAMWLLAANDLLYLGFLTKIVFMPGRNGGCWSDRGHEWYGGCNRIDRGPPDRRNSVRGQP